MQPLDPNSWLEHFVTSVGKPRVDEQQLEKLFSSGLAPYAYTRLSSDDPVTPTLRPAFTAATGRHIALRAELQRLVKAWRQADIQVLLFKGFYLAEFVYDTPAQRFYRDVDLVMEPARTREASRIAQSSGWVESWHASNPATMLSEYGDTYCGHEILHLVHPTLGVQLDVHRRILHNLDARSWWAGPQARITEAAWRASQPASFGPTELRVLSPEDSILIGPVLNRSWGEDWVLQPQDYLDFRMLVERFRISRAALETRARTLGCLRTLTLFLERCNPYEAHFALRAPTRAERRRWNLVVVPERGHAGLVSRFIDATGRPRQAVAVFHQLPTALRVLRLVRNGLPAREIARRLETHERTSGLLTSREWRALKSGAAGALTLLRASTDAFWPAYVLTIYAGLRRRGCPAALVGEDDLGILLEGRRLLLED